MENSGIFTSELPEDELPSSSIWAFLHEKLEKYSDLTVMVCGETSKSHSYKDLTKRSLQWAKELKKHFPNGEHPPVGLVLPNCVECPVVFLGNLAAGFPTVPIRPDLNLDVFEYIVYESQPRVLVIDSLLVEKFRSVIEKHGGEMMVFVRGSSGETSPSFRSLSQVFRGGNDNLDIEDAKKVDPESLAFLAFTSGTTGKPKGIMISQSSLINIVTCYSNDELCPFQKSDGTFQDVELTLLPLTHVFSLYYYSIVVTAKGGKLVIYDFKKGTNLTDLCNAVEKYEPTVIHCAPPHLELFARIEHFEKCFSSVRAVITLGSPPNTDTLLKIQKKSGGRILVNDVYGTSEAGMVLHAPMKNRRLGMTGKVVPHCKVRVVDFKSGEVITTPNTFGELQIYSKMFMKGYLNNPKATKDVMTDDNWFKTGDCAYFDEDNYISVVERIIDLITVDGKTVCPSKIEGLLMQHEAVADVGVVGVVIPTTGIEMPKAFVVRKGRVEECELVSFVEERGTPEMRLLGGVSFVDSLPRNHYGKLIRKYVKELSWYKLPS